MTDVKPAKKRRVKAIDRARMIDMGDAQDIMRNQGKYLVPVAPTCVADLTSAAVLQSILSSLRCKGAFSPESIAGRVYGFTPTADCAANVAFVAALHKDDPGWNAELFFALLGEAAWWTLRAETRATFQAEHGTGNLALEHDAINAAVRAAIEPLLAPVSKGESS